MRYIYHLLESAMLGLHSPQINAKNLRADVISNKVRTKKMIKYVKSCGKEFQSLTAGVLYSSSVKGILEFCSDDCSKNYHNSVIK
jgi:hypothetical protein